MDFIHLIQSKLELYRLEQRYTRRKRRTTFVSEAQYVDGEYIYHNEQQQSQQRPTADGGGGLMDASRLGRFIGVGGSSPAKNGLRGRGGGRGGGGSWVGRKRR